LFHNILVGVDRSLHARAAVSQAVDIARTQGAALTLITVYSSVLPWPAMMPAALPQEVLEEFVEATRREAQAALDEASAQLPKGLSASTLSVDGTPAEVILDQAETGGHDLIVVGSRGRGDVASIMLGSVSHRVVHHSRVPVLVVHLPDADRGR
jgi:nucleotide-binding universal stress UspA family protein